MNPLKIHRLKYFKEFFGRIADKFWCCTWSNKVEKNGESYMAHCALGHLGMTNGGNTLTPEAQELCELLHPVAQKVITDLPREVSTNSVIRLNDNAMGINEPTPKARIMKALDMRMEMELETTLQEHEG